MKKKFNDNKQKQIQIINQVMKAIFKLPNEELLTFYKNIEEELKKRGVL